MKNSLFLFGLVLFFIGCSEDNEESNLNGIRFPERNLTLDYGEEIKLTVLPEPKDATLPVINFNSENSIVASVSKEGVVNALTSGETKITAQTKDHKFSTECNLIVVPTDYLFEEPFLNFGISVSQIKSLEKRDLNFQNGNKLIFAGENEYIAAVGYLLEDGWMKSAIVEFDASLEDAVERVSNFFKQRYISVKEEDGIYILASSDANIWVGIGNYGGTFAAVYLHSHSFLDINFSHKVFMTNLIQKYKI